MNTPAAQFSLNRSADAPWCLSVVQEGEIVPDAPGPNENNGDVQDGEAAPDVPGPNVNNDDVLVQLNNVLELVPHLPAAEPQLRPMGPEPEEQDARPANDLIAQFNGPNARRALRPVPERDPRQRPEPARQLHEGRLHPAQSRLSSG